MKIRERARSLVSSDMVLESLADILAYRGLSLRLGPGAACAWLWPGLAMRLGVIPGVEPGAGSPGSFASPSEPGCRACSLPGPSSPTSLQSEAHTAETPRQGGGHKQRQPPSCLPVASQLPPGIGTVWFSFRLYGDACLISTLSPGGTHSGMGLEAWPTSWFLARVSFPLEH